MRPSFAFRLPSPVKQAWGRPGARCTRGLAGVLHSNMLPTSIQVQLTNTPASPTQRLYGLYEIVLVTGFVATIALGQR